MIQTAIAKYRILRDDLHMREVVRGAMLAFFMKVAGAGLAFAFSVVLARLLGASGAGLYFLALSVTVIGSVAGRVGLDDVLLRFVASHAARGEWGELRRVYRRAATVVAAVAGAIALAGFLLAPWLAQAVFNKPVLGEPLRWMCLAILPFALINLQAESLKGLKRIREAMLVQSIGIPLLGLLLVWPLAQSAGVEGAALAYLAATLVVATAGAVVWRNTAFGSDEVRSVANDGIWASCKSLFLTSLISKGVLPWLPFLLLGIWASSEEVGIFGVANRIVLAVGLLLAAVNSVLSPKFAELYVRREMTDLRHTAKRSALLTTLLASPLLIVLMVGGEWILAIFGPEFTSGAQVLAILAAGQFVNIFCGSIGQLLVMSGNEADVAKGMLVLAIVLITASLLLMPDLGMVGGAMATSISLLVWNAWMAVVAKKRLGFTPVPI